MNWIALIDPGQVDEIKAQSKFRPQVIFKHSTRCSTSQLVKRRLERTPPPDSIDFYVVDLISYRSLSNKIADEFGIEHESPQVLIIKNGSCVYAESHMGIDMESILMQTTWN